MNCMMGSHVPCAAAPLLDAAPLLPTLQGIWNQFLSPSFLQKLMKRTITAKMARIPKILKTMSAQSSFTLRFTTSAIQSEALQQLILDWLLYLAQITMVLSLRRIYPISQVHLNRHLLLSRSVQPIQRLPVRKMCLLMTATHNSDT